MHVNKFNYFSITWSVSRTKNKIRIVFFVFSDTWYTVHSNSFFYRGKI